MTDQQIIIEVAKLDGKSADVFYDLKIELFVRKNFDNSLTTVTLPSYLTSRDAIIPVIEKMWIGNGSFKFMNGIDFRHALHKELQKPGPDQHELPNCPCEHDMIAALTATPRQLCIALLKACGKWEE